MFRLPYNDYRIDERLICCALAVCGWRLMYCTCGTYFDIDEANYIRKERWAGRVYDPDVWCPNCGKCVIGPHRHEDNKAKVAGVA